MPDRASFQCGCCCWWRKGDLVWTRGDKIAFGLCYGLGLMKALTRAEENSLGFEGRDSSINVM